MLKLKAKVRQVKVANALTNKFDYTSKPLTGKIMCPGYNLDGEKNDAIYDKTEEDQRIKKNTSAIRNSKNNSSVSGKKNKKVTSPQRKNQDIFSSGEHMQDYSEELEEKLQQVNEQADVGSNILGGTMQLLQSEQTRRENVQAAKEAMSEEEYHAVELRDQTMAQLKSQDPKAWDYEPSAELMTKRYPEMPHAYFNQKGEDAFKVVQASQYKYHKNIRIEEEKMMENRILKTYFESIFKPMKFGDDKEEDFQIGYEDDFEESKNGMTKRKVKPSFDQLLDVEQMGIQNRVQLIALFRAIRDVSQERQFGLLNEKMQALLITEYQQDDLDAAYIIYKKIVEQDIKNKIVPLDILKMSRDPETALENVIERKEALDTTQMKPSKNNDKSEDEDVAEQVGAEVGTFNGMEKIDKTTVRHIGFFKALNEGKDQKFLDDIRNFKLFEDDINNFLCDNEHPSGLSKFNARVRLENCTRCKQIMPKNDDDQAWKSDDGMTDSIMSDEEDRLELKMMKEGKYNEQTKMDTVMQSNKVAGSTFAGDDAKTIVMKLGDIIENIDQLSQRANNIVMTRSEFLNCLRECTAQKLKSIKEAKDIFNARVKKLLRAQQYELKSQEMFGVNAAQEVFKQKGHEVRKLFQMEISELLKEYRQLHELIRFYQKKLKSQCSELCTQEQIVAKLSNHVSVNMKGRFDSMQAQREVIAQYPHYEDKSDPNAKAPDDYELDPINALLKEPFDFYGKEVRLSQTEQMRVVTNAVIKEKNSEIRRLTDQQDFMQSQCEEIYDLLKKSCDSEIQLKIKVHEFENQIKQLKLNQKKDLENLDEKHKSLEDKLLKEIQRQHKEMVNLKTYNKFDNTITSKVADVLDGQVKMYKENARRMRAVLRVPRLCKLYHDQVRQDNMEEFDPLDKIYEAHYAVVQKEVFYDDDDKIYNKLTEADKTLLARQPEYSPPKTMGLESATGEQVTKGSSPKKSVITEGSGNKFKQKFSVGACGGPFSSKQSTAIDKGNVSKSMPKMDFINKHAINNRLMTQAATQRNRIFDDKTLNTSFNLNYIKKQYKGLDMFLQRGYEKKPQKKQCSEFNDLKVMQPPVSQRQNHRNHSINVIASQPNPHFNGGLTQRHIMSSNLNQDSQANNQFVNTNPILFSNPLNMTARYSDHPHQNLLSMSIASDVYSPNQMFGEGKGVNGTPFNNDIINKSIEIVHKSSNQIHKNMDRLGTNAGTNSTANDALNKTGMSISLPNSSLFKETSRENTKDKDIDFTKYFEQNMMVGNQDKIFKQRPFFIQNQKASNINFNNDSHQDSVLNSLPSVQRGPSELELVGSARIVDRFGQNSVDFMYLSGKAAGVSVPNSRVMNHRTIEHKNHSFVLSPKMTAPIQNSPTTKGKRKNNKNDWQAISQTQNELFRGQKFLKPVAQLPSLKKKKISEKD